MIDPARIHITDQAIAYTREVWCPALFAMYQGCIEAGFDQGTALYLTTKYLEQLARGDG